MIIDFNSNMDFKNKDLIVVDYINSLYIAVKNIISIESKSHVFSSIGVDVNDFLLKNKNYNTYKRVVDKLDEEIRKIDEIKDVDINIEIKTDIVKIKIYPKQEKVIVPDITFNINQLLGV